MINEAPGPVVETMPTLLEAIKEYDFNLYNEKYKAFSKNITMQMMEMHPVRL